MRRLLLIWACFIALFSHGDKYEDALYKAFDEDSIELSTKFFHDASLLIENDTQHIKLAYFKYFYFNDRDDEVRSLQYEKEVMDLSDKLGYHVYYFALKDYENWNLLKEGRFTRAITKSIEFAEKAREIKDTVHWVQALSNASISFHDLSQFEKGIEYGKTGLHLIGLMHDPPDEQHAIALNAVAINFDDWGKLDSALYYHRKVIPLKEISTSRQCNLYNNMGNTLLKQGKLDSALKYIEMALEVNENKSDGYHQSTYLNNLADIHLRKNNLQKARFYLDSAVFYSILSGSIEKKRDVYNTCYRYFQKTKQLDSAFKYQGLYHQFKDSMLQLDRQKSINQMEIKVVEAEKNKELANAALKLRSRNFWILVFALGLIIALILLRQFYLKRQKIAQENKLKIQEERLRISRDLHDNIGAELTFISSTIDQKTYSIDDPKQREELEILSNSSRNAMTQLRETIWAIKSDEITVDRFAQKLRQLTSRYSKALQFEVVVTHKDADAIMRPSLVINLFRVCQEAVNNALKYANCDRVEISITTTQKDLVLIIEDKGVGFDIQQVALGYGLQNMKERILEISGDFKAESVPSKGTMITVSAPLYPNSSPTQT